MDVYDGAVKFYFPRGCLIFKLDRIVTFQNAIDISCPTCNLAMGLRLISAMNRENSPGQAALHSGDQADDLDSAQIEATTQRRNTALKAKILRSLVNLPPMPHIILKAHGILSDPASSLKDLAKVIEGIRPWWLKS